MYPALDILSGPGSSWAAIPGPAATELSGPPAAVVGLAVALVLAGCALRRLARVRRALGIGQDADPRAGSAPAAPERAEPGTESPPRREPSPWPEATARLEPATLDALGEVIGEARRRRVAGERMQRELVPVLEAGWLVERDIAIGGGGRIPWLVMGASGVFALEACDGCWTLERLAALAVRVDALGAALAGYDGPLIGAVVLAFDESAPRRWYGGAELAGRGAWLLGLDWLLPWMFSFGPNGGIAGADLRRLGTSADASLTRCGSARLPAVERFG